MKIEDGGEALSAPPSDCDEIIEGTCYKIGRFGYTYYWDPGREQWRHSSCVLVPLGIGTENGRKYFLDETRARKSVFAERRGQSK